MNTSNRAAGYIEHFNRWLYRNWWLVFLLAVCLMIGTCFLEAPAQDKYKEARKRLSTPEIVLPDIDIRVQPDTLALRLFIQAQAADTMKHTIREVKE